LPITSILCRASEYEPMKSRASNFRLGKLSSEKRALLALRALKSHESAVKNRQGTIRRRTRADGLSVFPLSFAQERLWILDQLKPGNVAYNMPGALRIKGVLDVEVLKRAIGEIIERHEVLRTTFEMKEERLVQVIHPAPEVKIEVVRLEQKEAGERETAIRQLVREEAQKPFDLARGPLLRVKLVRASGEEHVLLFTMHHIVSDGWSMGVLAREFGELYEAFIAGHPSPLKELPIQYADYSVWQREWLSGEELNRQLEYWRGQLRGEPPGLRLPTDWSCSERRSLSDGVCSITFPELLIRGLKGLSRDQGVTLFMLLLAGFKVLLHHYSREEDIMVETYVANRNSNQVEELIGFFVNYLVLRTDLSGDPGFLEILGRVKKTVLQAYAHQELPFQKLIAELHLGNNLQRSNLVQVVFMMQQFQKLELKWPELSLESMPLEQNEADLDLNVSIIVREQSLTCVAQYNTGLFREATIRNLLDGYVAVLEQVLSAPEQKLSRFSLIEALKASSASGWTVGQKVEICIAATFTAEPLEEPIGFWMEELDVPFEIKFAPYDQVFQQLLDPASVLSGNTSGANIVLLRLEDWWRNKVLEEEELRKRVAELMVALKAAVDRASVPYLIGFCPASPDFQHRTAVQQSEDKITEQLSGVQGVYFVQESEWTLLYRTDHCYDRHGDELGHIPYTLDFFAVMGTVLADRIHGFRSSPGLERMQRIAGDLASGEKLHRAISLKKRRQRPRALAEFKAPQTPIEEILAGIWSEVLGIETVGVQDDFFALGGHSLMGTVMLSRVRETFHLDLPLHHLFETPTIAELAEVIGKMIVERSAGEGADPSVEALQELSEEELDRLIAEERQLAQVDASRPVTVNRRDRNAT